MRTKFFCTNFLNTARGPGHPGKIPGTSRIPLFETQGRQSFEGGHEVFGHHPFAWKTPTPPGGLRTQKLNLCALFSCLRDNQITCKDGLSHLGWTMSLELLGLILSRDLKYSTEILGEGRGFLYFIRRPERPSTRVFGPGMTKTSQ